MSRSSVPASSGCKLLFPESALTVAAFARVDSSPCRRANSSAAESCLACTSNAQRFRTMLGRLGVTNGTRQAGLSGCGQDIAANSTGALASWPGASGCFSLVTIGPFKLTPSTTSPGAALRADRSRVRGDCVPRSNTRSCGGNDYSQSFSWYASQRRRRPSANTRAGLPIMTLQVQVVILNFRSSFFCSTRMMQCL